VVVDTGGSRIYIGRYHSENEQGVLLHDADVRDVGTGEEKAAYLARSARLGVFKNTERVVVPRAEVQSLKRLVEFAPEAAP
jgi:hypothetical protein